MKGSSMAAGMREVIKGIRDRSVRRPPPAWQGIIAFGVDSLPKGAGGRTMNWVHIPLAIQVCTVHLGRSLDHEGMIVIFRLHDSRKKGGGREQDESTE